MRNILLLPLLLATSCAPTYQSPAVYDAVNHTYAGDRRAQNKIFETAATIEVYYCNGGAHGPFIILGNYAVQTGKTVRYHGDNLSACVIMADWVRRYNGKQCVVDFKNVVFGLHQSRYADGTPYVPDLYLPDTLAWVREDGREMPINRFIYLKGDELRQFYKECK